MSVELNHFILPSHDKRVSAEFLAGILGVEVGAQVGPFMPVRLANGVTIDFEDGESSGFDRQFPDDFQPHHCAFLVGESEFDAIFARIQASGAKYWADPSRQSPGEINHLFGGRGVYFDDPNGHLMEVATWVIPDPSEVPRLLDPSGREIEPTKLLERMLRELQKVVDGVTPDHMTAATPCTEWDVRALLNHVIGGVIMYGNALTTGGPAPADDVVADDPSRVLRRAAEQALAAWRQPDAMQRRLSLPFGELAGGALIGFHLMDVYVHGLDLAVATGQEEKLDPKLAEMALSLAGQLGLDNLRIPGVFGAKVPCPESAPAHRRLLAFLGRRV